MTNQCKTTLLEDVISILQNNSDQKLSIKKIATIYISAYKEKVNAKPNPKDSNKTKEEQINREIGSVLSRYRTKYPSILRFDKTNPDFNKVHYQWKNENTITSTKLNRKQIENNAIKHLTTYDKYRYSEFDHIKKVLNESFNANFHVEHAYSIHEYKEKAITPNNLQIMAQRPNLIKASNSQPKLSFFLQCKHIREYIKSLNPYDEPIHDELLECLLDRLKVIY